MTPTVVVRMADAGDVYTSWRWVGDTAPAGVGIAPDEQVRGVLSRLAAALPNIARPGGLERALTTGSFSAYVTENDLAQELSRVFLPYRLAVTLHELMTRGVRPHIRIQPSPRVAQVPWELIAPDPAVRLIDIADVSTLAPVTAAAASRRTWARTSHLPVVAVLDPRVPGFRADSELGSVLGRPDSSSPVAKHVAGLAESGRLRPIGGPFRRTDVDRDWLSDMLRAGASRLVYVGHVTAAAPESGRSETAYLHLACAGSTLGHEPTVRTHRPLSARDLLLGTYGLTDDPVAGEHIWPMPSRVALIACESGGDMRFTEALGLVTAMVRGGAELVTATRWALPTDHAFARFAEAGVRPLQDAVVAIDSAHDSRDAVVQLCAWQRERLAIWREGRTVGDSPLLWGAFATVAV